MAIEKTAKQENILLGGCAFISSINQLCIYNLRCTAPDVIHPLYLQHLILRFELLGDAFLFGKLIDQLTEHFIGSLIGVGEVFLEDSGGQKGVV